MSRELIKEFKIFIRDLHGERLSLEEAKDFSGLKKLPDLMHGLNGMIHEHHLVEISKTTGLEVEEIDNGISAILDEYFKSFEGKNNELFLHLKEKTGDYFAFKKAYQLSHAAGVRNWIEEIPDLGEDTKRYFHSISFIDYFESLRRLLCPIIALKTNKLWGHSTALKDYKFLQETYPNTVFTKLDLEFRLSKPRNWFSHSCAVFEDDKLIVFDQKGENGDLLEEHPSDDFLSHIKSFMALLVVCMTKMDLKILQIGIDDRDCFPKWMEYFGIYVDYFERNYTVRDSLKKGKQ